jgi:ParB family chromosome partitioning protein
MRRDERMELMNELETSKLFVGEINVRKSVGDITELKLSIQEQGILQPLLVRPQKNKYEVVVGSRRYEAAKALGLKKVPVIVRPLTDGEALSVSLVENIQRNDLELEEEAEGILKLMKLEPRHFASVKAVAKALGRSEGAIRELLDAYELTFKLREGGMKIHAARAPPEEERKRAEAIPIKHTQLVSRALKTEEVRKLSPREFERKVPEIVRAIAPLPEADARKVVDRFKMFPERSVQRIKEEALAKQTGVAVKVYFAPRTARALDQAAEERDLSEEELVSIAVEEWLVLKGYLKSV